jgi:glutathionylspermidine synthase
MLLAHNELTEEFLATVADAGTGAGEIATTVHSSVVASSYLGRALSRPVFLTGAEYRRLIEDTNNLYTAVTRLPGQLHGSDLAAFARSVGMNELQIAAVLRNRNGQASRLGRADFCRGERGFQLTEINVGSTLGGLDNALLNEGMLTAPHISAFVAKHGLVYVDTLAAVVETLLAECEIPAGTRPVMAAADWPESFETLAPQLHRSAAMLVPLGLDAQACHVGQLKVADGRVWLEDKAVDVIYRLWTMEDQLSEVGAALIEPLLAAADRGEVKIFTPMDGRLFGNKGLLALVSDEQNRHLLTPAERESVDRALPWTRMLRTGPVTVDGRTVDLAEYAISEREQLILKPTALYGGKGIVPGWLTGPEEWRERIEAAMDTPYLVQRRINVLPEMFPTDDGLEPWTLVWGVFLMRAGAGGIWVRGTRGAISSVAGMTAGGTGTCCFHEPAD